MKKELTDQERVLLEQAIITKKCNQTYVRILSCQDDSFVSKHQVIWQQNNTRLLFYPGTKKLQKKVILVIPSLINRAYILDIHQERTVIGYLQDQGLDSYLVDWGDPLMTEHEYGFEDYYNHKIEPVITLLKARGVENIVVLGHCLGGLLALAVAQLNQQYVKGVALINVPWDFQRYQQLLPIYQTILDHMIEQNPLISSLYVRQFLMAENRGYLWYDKLTKIDESSEEGKLAIKVEKWSLDNLYITGGVFVEIIKKFIEKNSLLHHGLTLNKVTVNAKDISTPVFVVLAALDQVVPYESGIHLKNDHRLSQSRLLESGHLAAILSKDAKQKIWHHFVKWTTLVE